MSAIFFITFISWRYITWRKKLPRFSVISSSKKRINLNYLIDFFVCFDFEENKIWMLLTFFYRQKLEQTSRTNSKISILTTYRDLYFVLIFSTYVYLKYFRPVLIIFFLDHSTGRLHCIDECSSSWRTTTISRLSRYKSSSFWTKYSHSSKFTMFTV